MKKNDMVAVILEDHKIFAETFKVYLEATGLFYNILVYETEQDAMQFFHQRPRVKAYFFLDYYIPNTNTFNVISEARKLYPSVLMVVVTSMTNSDLIKKLLASNVNGLISKSDGIKEILDGIQAISEGELFLSPRMLQVLHDNGESLLLESPTRRELEVLTGLSLGKSVTEISDELSISKYTVITHRKNLMRKTQCSTMAELVAYALKAGLISST
jgi:DNA-binding NarL/FixJ family response regulator